VFGKCKKVWKSIWGKSVSAKCDCDGERVKGQRKVPMMVEMRGFSMRAGSVNGMGKHGKV
jgi:hypothetical protein